MDPIEQFRDLVAKAKNADEEAAAALYERFSQHVRRIARIKLSNSAIRQRVDEEDVCQSVFGVFFRGLRDGRFRVESIEDLQRLLADIARKRVLKVVERHTTGKRDVANQAEMGDAALDPMSEESTASVKASRNELVDRFLRDLTDEERYVLDQRCSGRSWDELAAELKTSADALRVRISRITKTARERLGIDID